MLGLGAVLSVVHAFSSPHNCVRGTSIIPILQMKNLKLRELTCYRLYSSKAADLSSLLPNFSAQPLILAFNSENICIKGHFKHIQAEAIL